VPSYLVETFLARDARGERQARERRARSAAEAMTREGTHVGLEGSIHVPEDEICFFTFAAACAEQAALVAQRAGLEPLRVVEAIPSGKAEP
jgi:3-hydroxyisobutyrate dehydrogenase-like beta-hydroxyacid dehydrogenase